MRSAVDENAPAPLRSRAFWVAGAFVAMLAITGVALVISGPRHTHRLADSSVAAAASVGGGAPLPAAAGVGELPCQRAGDGRVPTSSPAGTRWELVGSMAAPTAPKTVGPGRTGDGYRSCFARSPLGALYAAVNVLAQLTAHDAPDVFARYAVPSPETDQDLRKARLFPHRRLDDGGVVQIAGFRVAAYDAQTAVLDLVIRATSGTRTGIARMPLTMRWYRGDWRVVDTPGKLPIDHLDNLDGYVPWGGA